MLLTYFHSSLAKNKQQIQIKIKSSRSLTGETLFLSSYPCLVGLCNRKPHKKACRAPLSGNVLGVAIWPPQCPVGFTKMTSSSLHLSKLLGRAYYCFVQAYTVPKSMKYKACSVAPKSVQTVTQRPLCICAMRAGFASFDSVCSHVYLHEHGDSQQAFTPVEQPTLWCDKLHKCETQTA